MRTFLVEKETIDRILTFIDREQRRAPGFRQELEKELKIDFQILIGRVG